MFVRRSCGTLAACRGVAMMNTHKLTEAGATAWRWTSLEGRCEGRVGVARRRRAPGVQLKRRRDGAPAVFLGCARASECTICSAQWGCRWGRRDCPSDQ